MYERIAHFEKASHDEDVARRLDEFCSRDGYSTFFERWQVVAQLSMIGSHKRKGQIRVRSRPANKPVPSHLDAELAVFGLILLDGACWAQKNLQRRIESSRVEECILISARSDGREEPHIRRCLASIGQLG